MGWSLEVLEIVGTYMCGYHMLMQDFLSARAWASSQIPDQLGSVWPASLYTHSPLVPPLWTGSMEKPFAASSNVAR